MVPAHAHPEGEEHRPGAGPEGPSPDSGRISEPAKLVRLMAMSHHLLEELHHDHLDSTARALVDSSHRESLRQIRALLPDDNRQELDRLLAPFEQAGPAPPSEADLRLAEAQLYGWLEGLLKGLETDEALRQTGEDMEELAGLQEHQARRSRPSESDDRRGYG